MNAPVTQPAFAHLIPADTYAAWRVLGDGTSQPLDLLGRTNLRDAVEAAMQGCRHKDHFTILHTAPNGRRTEHVYYVKQKAAQWVQKPGFAHVVQIRPLDFEHRFSRQLAEFSPVEMFRAVAGADVVGEDRSVVEAR